MITPDEIKTRLVEAIEETSWVVEGGDAHDLLDACNMAHASMADALALIQKMEAQVPMWNSANNPPKNWRKNDEKKTLVNYLVYSPDYGVDIGNWVEPAKMWCIMGLPACVTHWMLLPTPLKEV